MIDELIFHSGVACCGGFIAYYNDMSLYCPDPAIMFSRAIAILISNDGRLLISPVDLTRPDDVFNCLHFERISRAEFGSRSFGVLFARGCYFSIDTGHLCGSYQISHDLVVSDRFPSAKAYCKYLLRKS